MEVEEAYAYTSSVMVENLLYKETERELMRLYKKNLSLSGNKIKI